MVMLELLQNPLLSTLTFLIGLLVGHRTALWRDVRKEFNQAADPVRAFLLAERKGPGAYRVRPGVVELYGVEQRLTRWRRKRFTAAWQTYERACEQARQKDALGQVAYRDTVPILAAVEACLAFVRLR
jgi:hypothetical protein